MEQQRVPDEPQVVITEITDPQRLAEGRAVDEQTRRNGDWLQTHWSEVLPQARGKFLAVAGQQPFIADTMEEALALARAAHPDDRGLLLQYIRTTRGPRIYAHRR
jgi:hypothetical protein